jgi:hypothetical protein
MRTIKKFVFSMAIVASLTSTTIQAECSREWTGYDSVGGVGYQESVMVPSLTPYIALVTVAALAIVAVAIRHAGHSHHHDHNHCH